MNVERTLHTETFVEFTDDTGTTIDTAYGVLFDDGWLCDNCLGPDAVMDSNLALARWAHTKGSN